jgi:Transaldolase/Fructose-6-phosphate aldolase
MTPLTIDIYADGADVDEMLDALKQPYIKGFTTNPTLMRKAGVTDYEVFASKVLAHIKDLPISFEVFSDDFGEIEQQAGLIDSWGPHVYVKIHVTNTEGGLRGKGHPHFGEGRHQAERHRAVDGGPVVGGGGGAGRGRPGHRVRVRWAHRRHGRGSLADHEGVVAGPQVPASGEAAVGQSARAAEPGAGRPDGLPRHHGDARHPQETAFGPPQWVVWPPDDREWLFDSFAEAVWFVGVELSEDHAVG